MTLKQTRRTVSLSKATYDAATAAAAREGIATAEWVTRLIRKACPELPEQLHASRAEDRAAASAQAWKNRRASVTPPPVVLRATAPSPPTRLDLDRMAAERRLRSAGIPPGTYCANCIDRRATHRGRIDLSGVIYDLCDACELPKNEEREGWHEQRGTVAR